MEGGHDAALPDDIGRPRDAGARRRQAQHKPLALDVDEVCKAGVPGGNRLDGIDAPAELPR